MRSLRTRLGLLAVLTLCGQSLSLGAVLLARPHGSMEQTAPDHCPPDMHPGAACPMHQSPATSEVPDDTPRLTCSCTDLPPGLATTRGVLPDSTLAAAHLVPTGDALSIVSRSPLARSVALDPPPPRS